MTVRLIRGARGIGAAVLALATATLVPGCGGTQGDQPAASWRGGRSTGLPAVSPSSSSKPAAVDVTLAFAGDVHFSNRTATLLSKSPSTAFGPVTQVLSAADIAVVNLETAVTNGGTPEPKEFHFRAPPASFEAIRGAGVDAVTLANNHALDYGQTGLADTREAARAARVPVLGVGTAAEAYAPWIAEAKGVRVAFLALSQVHELESTWTARDARPGLAMAGDGTRAAAAVRAAKQSADFVVVYVHWGREGAECPIGEQKTLAKTLADAGADLIVGTHAHLLQGAGWLGRSYVAYGLGNFLWWRDDAFSNDTGVLTVTIRDKAIVRTEFVPAVISRTTGQPVPVAGAESERLRSKFDRLRTCTGLAAARQ